MLPPFGAIRGVGRNNWWILVEIFVWEWHLQISSRMLWPWNSLWVPHNKFKQNLEWRKIESEGKSRREFLELESSLPPQYHYLSATWHQEWSWTADSRCCVSSVTESIDRVKLVFKLSHNIIWVASDWMLATSIIIGCSHLMICPHSYFFDDRWSWPPMWQSDQETNVTDWWNRAVVVPWKLP